MLLGVPAHGVQGLRISLAAPDDFGKLLAMGLVTSFALQVFVIVGGVTRLIPLTGITLPFVNKPLRLQPAGQLRADRAAVPDLRTRARRPRRPAVGPGRHRGGDGRPLNRQIRRVAVVVVAFLALLAAPVLAGAGRPRLVNDSRATHGADQGVLD